MIHAYKSAFYIVEKYVLNTEYTSLRGVSLSFKICDASINILSELLLNTKQHNHDIN